MKNLQKIGGIAALAQATAYIIGFAMVFTLLAPYLSLTADNPDPLALASYLTDNLMLMYLWHLIIYVIAGVFMVPLVLALHERLRSQAEPLMQLSSGFGLIWAGLVIASGMLIISNQEFVAQMYQSNPQKAAEAMQILSSVEQGLGGGVELPGGLWVLLLSLAAWRTVLLPKGLNVLGVIVGTAGILTVLPGLGDLGAVFGLGFIPWFIWAGVIMLRSEQHAQQSAAAALTS